MSLAAANWFLFAAIYGFSEANNQRLTPPRAATLDVAKQLLRAHLTPLRM
jgi:hypothetical protein